MDDTDRTENYLSLSDAARLAPGRPHVSCLWRWCRRGTATRGGERVYLRHVRAGARVFTTAPWLREYLDALAAADRAYFDRNYEPPAPKPKRGEAARQRAVDRARRELAHAGV